MSWPEASGPMDFDGSLLDAAGLNLQAVFNLADLPSAIGEQLAAGPQWRQLILIGHGGRAMWDAVKASGIASADPIDDFTASTVAQWFVRQYPAQRYELIYPGSRSVGLQALGKLAGWHHDSPFMVGINQGWGTWYAYRAALLTDTAFKTTPVVSGVSPCLACSTPPCIAACPAGALAGGTFALDKCIAWRKLPDSSCRTGCLARIACPVASEHRYSSEQIRHSYAISLRMIEQFY